MLYVNTLWMRYCHKGKSSANKLITLVKLPLINSVSFDWVGWIKLRHCDGTTENQQLMLQHRWNNISPIKSLCYQNFIVPPPPSPFHVWFNQNNIEIEFSVFLFRSVINWWNISCFFWYRLGNLCLNMLHVASSETCMRISCLCPHFHKSKSVLATNLYIESHSAKTVFICTLI